ncbi:hypothetical protein [Marinobacter sp.]|uniref:hypothetical protein n=1 Tax=Marinobacter sp. TaxID=50741 RepID=UPI0035689C80
MGMPLPNTDMLQRSHCHQVNWQGQPDSGQVSIAVSADCLCRLLKHRQLHVEDLTCLDPATKSKVREMLLFLLS